MENYQWVGNIYPDWFRQPMSPLEQTWRAPVVFQSARQMAKEKFGLSVPDDYYTIKDGWLFVRTDWSRLLRQWHAIPALIKFCKGLWSEKANFETKLLPEYKNQLGRWKQELAELKIKDNLELWRFANEVMERDVFYAVQIVFVGAYGFLLESLLRKFYAKFVRDKPYGYADLLIGFPNRA